MNWICWSAALLLMGGVLASAEPVPATNLVLSAVVPTVRRKAATNAIPSTVNRLDSVGRRNAPVSAKPASLPPLQPGVYETAPFACLVIVPGPHPDDQMVVGAGRSSATVLPMPTIKPDLQFIPRSPRK